MKRFALALLIASIARPVFAADAPAYPEIKPLALLQVDLNSRPRDQEGESGLSLARARLGVWAKATENTFGLVSAEFMRPEHPEILDALVRGNCGERFSLTVGYFRSPLFLSARSELEGTMPFPELSLPVRAAWPNRDAALEAHYAFKSLPFEAWLRLSNGSSSPFENDNAALAVTARVDSSFGRASFDAKGTEETGGRVGFGILVDDSFDRGGIGGSTASGFPFYRPPVVSGLRTIGEFHALGYIGPVRGLAEAFTASEERIADVDGNPSTPRLPLDPVRSRGASAEIAWMVTGQHRLLGQWPIAPGSGPGVEVAARIERVELARSARDIAGGGGSNIAVAISTWLNEFASVSVAWNQYRYDIAPIEEPGELASWLLQARATFYLNPPPGRRGAR